MQKDDKETNTKDAEIDSYEGEGKTVEEKETEKDKNVDHGWAWVVMAALPVLTIGLRFLSTRQCLMIAGVLSSAAFIGGSFATNTTTLLFTNGFLSVLGLAFSFLHGPLAYLIGIYFIKRRNLAQAITISGGQLGGLLFPPLYGYLIRKYGLQGGMLLTGGIHLNIIALAILLRPKRINIITTIQGKLNRQHFSTSNIAERKQMIQNNDDEKMMNSNGMFNEMKRSFSESLLKKIVKHEPVANHILCNLDLHLTKHNRDRIITEKYVDSLSRSNILSVVSNSLPVLKVTNTSHILIKGEAKQTCCQFVDVSLMKAPFMWIYALVYCFGRVPNAYNSIYIAPLAHEAGISNSRIADLVSLINACDFIGMILCGFVADRKLLKNYVIVILSLCFTGVCLSLSSLCSAYWHFILFSIATGISAGGIFALTPTVVADFMGIENFRSAMGILVLFQGVSLSASGPFLGKFI
ncbi:monocarboxylate transporter 5-like [Mytilus californianus]|uniref:monocarboxylate transporter 5-like n=1 Tax=Mytilus californianus TaxID=6549 RepID=UPI0022461724|nr:monocarboxylate transporter 5-like [Mytilus californianus]